MTRYLISFDDGAMTFPEGASRRGRRCARGGRQAEDAGVWVFGGGLKDQEGRAWWASRDGQRQRVPREQAVCRRLRRIDVPSREEALQWAAKFAVACRCAQDVREFVPDPAV